MSDSYKIVGQSVRKKDVEDKVRGKSKFGADIKMPGMLHAKVLRSAYAHALIKNIDTGKAEAMPGVAAVITSKNMRGTNRFGIIVKDEPALAEEKVRCFGDAVAVVAAETEEIALAALKQIKVDYEELPAVFSMEEAMQEEAPKVHPNNILTADRIIKGNAEEILGQCDLVISRTYTTQMIEHSYIEPEAGIAYLDGDVVVIKVATQNPHYDRKDVAANLALPQNQVRIVQVPTGGGFGGKLDISVQIHLALLAQKTGRPVRMVYDREESFRASSKRHPFIIEYTTGATKEGLIQAIKVKLICDTGAYASYGPATIKRALVHATGPYEVPHVSVESYCVYTNNPRAGAMRGFGVPQVAFAHESQMDELARQAGISPFEVRKKNALKIGAVTATGQELKGSVGLVETLDEVNTSLAQYLKERVGEGA
ncbi:MAG: xanthine dehydrogenase family protein molybdopterin-binding subunit [Dehalobacterium sp.]